MFISNAYAAPNSSTSAPGGDLMSFLPIIFYFRFILFHANSPTNEGGETAKIYD